MTAYGTAAQLRSRINKTAATDDAVLTALLAAASNAIDRVTNHDIQGIDVFYPTAPATARYYAGSGLSYQWIDECVSITSVAVKDSPTDTTYTTWAAADWQAFTGSYKAPDFNSLPYTGLLVKPLGDYTHFTSGRVGASEYYWEPKLAYEYNANITPTVQVTALWGVTATPPNEIVEVCYMLAARWWKRFESAMSDTLASGELGQLLYTQPIDPDVKFLLMNTRWYRPQVARRF